VIADLRQASPKFRLWWEQQDVRGLPDGPRAMQHPTLGALEFEHASFQTSFSTDMLVKVYVASPETAEQLAQALAAWPKTNAVGAVVGGRRGG
jgi:MmyB-like transcription regulator ligand binding domain